MKPVVRQNWILAALVLWGIPAFLFWIGVGFFVRLSWRWEMDECSKVLDRTMAGLSENTGNSIEVRLNRFFNELAGIPTNSPALATAKERFRKAMPSGLIRFSLFDDRGLLIPEAEATQAAVIQRVFDFVRLPWSEPFPKARIDFDDLANIIPMPNKRLSRIRDQEGSLHLVGVEDPKSPFCIWGFYRWKPPSQTTPPEGFPTKGIGGMLAFVSFNRVSDDFLLQEGIRQTPLSGCDAGFQANSICHPPPALSKSEFNAMLKQYRASPGNHFIFDRFLAAGSNFGAASTLLVWTPLPERIWAGLPVLLLAYALGSWVILSWLLRLFSSKVTMALPLWIKLAFLFLLGVAFPLFAAGGLGSLYLEEKREELRDANRKEAFNHLERVDRGFEKSLTGWQTFYQKLIADHSGARLDLPGVKEVFMKLLARCELQDFFIVSSESRLVESYQSPKDTDFMMMMRMPMKERLEYFEISRHRKEVFTKIDEVDCLYQRVDIASIEPRIHPDIQKQTRQFIIRVGQEAISFENQLNGITNRKAQKNSDLIMDDIVEEEGGAVYRAFKFNLGQIIPFMKMLKDGYLFADVLRDARGEGQYFIVMTSEPLSLQRGYLSQVFSESQRRTPDYELRAIGWHLDFHPSFPMQKDDPYRFLHEQLVRTGLDRLVLQMRVDGQEMEVVVQKGKSLIGLDLVHITPETRLASRLAPARNRVMIFLAGTALFSLLLGWILLKRILVPLQGLAGGIHALRRKEFGFRVNFESNDELGQLGRVLNATIEHMSEMELASVIQNTLYPARPLLVGAFEVTGKNIMTQAVGGDYFDYFILPDQRVAIILGDVSGHGVSAAIVTAMAKAGFTILCPLLPDDPEGVLSRINTQFMDILHRAKMMTCQLAILDPGKEELTICNAGQTFPVVVPRTGTANFLSLASSPLGVSRKKKSVTTILNLAEVGVVFYTDGLVEATNEEQKPFEFGRLMKVAEKTLQSEPSDPAEEIFAQVRRFTDPVPWTDDATVLIIRKIRA